MVYGFTCAPMTKAVRSKLIEGVNVALRGRSGVKVFGLGVIQFLHRSRDVEQDAGGGGTEPEGFPEASDSEGILLIFKKSRPFLYKRKVHCLATKVHFHQFPAFVLETPCQNHGRTNTRHTVIYVTRTLRFET